MSLRCSFIVLLWATATTLLLSACGAALHQSAEEAASGAVEGSVKEMESPGTRRALADILADPETEKSIEAIANAAASGALDSLSEPERAAKLAHATEELASNISRSLGESLRRELRTTIAEVVAESVQLSLERALSPAVQENAEAMFAAITRGAVRGIDEGMTEAELGPLTEVARAFAKEASLGFQDAVRVSAEHREATGQDRGNVLAAMSETADATLSYGPWLFVSALVSAVVVLLIALWLFARAIRRPEREDDPAKEAAALASALHSLEAGERATEVRARMERLAEHEGSESVLLKRILRRWPNGSSRETAPHDDRTAVSR